MNPNERHPRERGAALVIAMLVLLVVTVLGVMLMMAITIGRRTVGHNLRTTDALNVAESGVGEALACIRHGDIALDTANPRAVAQIFLANPGSVPQLGGPDSVGIGTKQPAGNWLAYSTSQRGPDALTVRFKTDASRTVIYKYDATKNPKINTVSGMPIYEVTSTGITGTARRTVVTEVIQKPFYANAKAALTAGHDIDFVGNAVVCGFNHSADTPTDSGKNKRGNNPDCIPYETGAGDLPAAWSTGAINNGGAAYQQGSVAWMPNQAGFYNGPWDAFGMSQADFLNWIGAPISAVPSNLGGIYYFDNNGVVGDQSTSVGIQNGIGEGLLYVDGDLTINAGFVYRGIIYVEGDLQMNGQAWVLGGIIVKGRSSVKQNGGATILYSSEAIARALAKYGGQFVTLSWREK